MDPMRREKDDQNLWNFILSLFFLVVLALAFWGMAQARGWRLYSIGPFEVFILLCAAFRLTRLMVYDKIMRWFRELFMLKREVEAGGKRYVELQRHEPGLRHTVNDLLGCPWCVGIWAALFSLFVYIAFPWGWLFDLFLAIAGLGSLLQIFANFLGWSAEGRKRSIERVGEEAMKI